VIEASVACPGLSQEIQPTAKQQHGKSHQSQHRRSRRSSQEGLQANNEAATRLRSAKPASPVRAFRRRVFRPDAVRHAAKKGILIEGNPFFGATEVAPTVKQKRIVTEG
jgi:hypothetical protein